VRLGCQSSARLTGCSRVSRGYPHASVGIRASRSNPHALCVTVVRGSLCLALYQLAWAQMKAMAIRPPPCRLLARLEHHAYLRPVAAYHCKEANARRCTNRRRPTRGRSRLQPTLPPPRGSRGWGITPGCTGYLRVASCTLCCGPLENREGRDQCLHKRTRT
jgi:hypothetical protein